MIQDSVAEAVKRHSLGEGPAPVDSLGRPICPDCLGSGEGELYEASPGYSDEAPEWLKEPCSLCQGEGHLGYKLDSQLWADAYRLAHDTLYGSVHREVFQGGPYAGVLGEREAERREVAMRVLARLGHDPQAALESCYKTARQMKADDEKARAA